MVDHDDFDDAWTTLTSHAEGSPLSAQAMEFRDKIAALLLLYERVRPAWRALAVADALGAFIWQERDRLPPELTVRRGAMAVQEAATDREAAFSRWLDTPPDDVRAPLAMQRVSADRRRAAGAARRILERGAGPGWVTRHYPGAGPVFQVVDWGEEEGRAALSAPAPWPMTALPFSEGVERAVREARTSSEVREIVQRADAGQGGSIPDRTYVLADEKTGARISWDYEPDLAHVPSVGALAAVAARVMERFESVFPNGAPPGKIVVLICPEHLDIESAALRGEWGVDYYTREGPWVCCIDGVPLDPGVGPARVEFRDKPQEQKDDV